VPHQTITGDQVSTVIGQQSVHINNYAPEAPAPRIDPDMSRTCPQCRKTTWRYTAACMHCNLDLEQWDKRSRGVRGWLTRLFGRGEGST
jgi:hypothetical protein